MGQIMDDEDHTVLRIGFAARNAIKRGVKLAEKWHAEHPALTCGAAQMALGASLLAWGVHSGAIEIGTQIVGTADDVVNTASLGGAASSAAVGLVAAKLVGGIGIVGMGGAVGVPAGILALGAAAVMAPLGYTVGDVTYGYLHAFNPAQFKLGASALVVGLGLLLNGARMLASDPLVRQGCAKLTETAIHLYRTAATVVASSLNDLEPWARGAGAIGAAALTGLGGAALGGAYAASTVTVLGSSTLGGVALSLGLVSAPVWPIIVGSLAAAAGGGALARHLLRKHKRATR